MWITEHKHWSKNTRPCVAELRHSFNKLTNWMLYSMEGVTPRKESNTMTANMLQDIKEVLKSIWNPRRRKYLSTARRKRENKEFNVLSSELIWETAHTNTQSKGFHALVWFVFLETRKWLIVLVLRDSTRPASTCHLQRREHFLLLYARTLLKSLKCTRNYFCTLQCSTRAVLWVHHIFCTCENLYKVFFHRSFV